MSVLPPPPRPTTPVEEMLFSERRPPGIRFTEHMTGYWSPLPKQESFDERNDYDEAAKNGRLNRRSLELTITIVAENLATMIADPNHEARFVGTARILAGNKSLDVLVNEGRFQLFVQEPEDIAGRQMLYKANFQTADGTDAEFTGFKAIRFGGGIAGFHVDPPPGSRIFLSRPQIWLDQTQLFFRLEPRGLGSPDVFLGILTISVGTFLRQLLTIRPVRAASRTEACDTVMRFLLFYGAVLRDIYGGAFARSRYAPPDWSKRRMSARPLRRADGMELVSTRLDVPTKDGVNIRLTRWVPRTVVDTKDLGDPIVLAPGFGVRAHSFAIDTVDKNYVEHLVDQNYDVWLLDYRASPELEASRGAFSLDHIGEYDWPAAIDEVIKQTKDRRRGTAGARVDVVAHCVAGAAFMMAALNGSLRGKIRSAVCSQVVTHPVVSQLVELKSKAGIATWLQLLGKRSLRVTVDATNTSRKTLFDRFLKFYPTEDPCDNPVCRYVRFVFGESYRHKNLNRRTHDAIIDMFGDPYSRREALASLRALRQLSRITARQRLEGEAGEDRYLTEANRAKIDFRLGLMWGKRNAIFLREGIDRSDAWLSRPRQDLPPIKVERIEIPEHGHMDCFIGAGAAAVAFPKIDEFLNAGR